MTGPQADLLLALALMGALGGLAWLVLQQHPRLAVTSWLVTMAFVPVWLGISIGFYFQPAVLVALLVVAALLPSATTGRPGGGGVLVWLVFGLATISFVLGGTAGAAFFALLTESVLAFALGRLAVQVVGGQWLYKAVAAVFTLVAAFAIVEFATGVNPFVELSRGNSLYAVWGTIQERGGQSRAEAAFGHSIALGCSLAIAIPLAMASTMRTRSKLTAVGVMLLGTLFSFSRVGILTAALGVGLSLVFLRQGLSFRARTVVATVGALVAVLVLPFVLSVLTSAGDEASDSAAYRGDLFSLLPSLVSFGESEALVRFADGTRRFGTFNSIDNELLLFALQFGWVPAAAMVAGLAVAVLVVLARRASPATISVVAQIPALSTVALITQYRMWFFFVVGVAVATHVGRSAPVATGPGSRPPSGGAADSLRPRRVEGRTRS